MLPSSSNNNSEHDDDLDYYSLLLLRDQQHDYCPCSSSVKSHSRFLQESGSGEQTWQIVFTCLVLFFMFLALVTDRLGADSIMLTALTAFMASTILSIQEGLAGFANQGLWTVLVLFVVAEGISKTGALDWYMGKLLGGPPQSTATAQLRLMVPIGIVSAFLNNTPVVAVLIPITQRWAKHIRVSAQQLLIPLSFASILGGTCTLIGTSTNLVVVGLLNERYAGSSGGNIPTIGLFSLGEYGVPVAMAGLAYILLASPWLLPGGARSRNKNGAAAEVIDTTDDDILLGARLTQWSPSAGRTVQRSGLRDTGGIYLVSVHRAATGNVHRAVSNDFVLNVNDILYFTGLVESFGEFCQEHGLEVITNEVEASMAQANAQQQQSLLSNTNGGGPEAAVTETLDTDDKPVAADESSTDGTASFFVPKLVNVNSVGGTTLPVLREDTEVLDEAGIPIEVGVTKESLLQADEAERMRSINRMTDMIRGDRQAIAAAIPASNNNKKRGDIGRNAAKIVVTIEKDLVVVGINARDRPGLMMDIAKGLLRFHLQLHHTEAAVVQDRSVSIWRCEMSNNGGGDDNDDDNHLMPDIEEIWSVLSALLSHEDGIEAMKQRGLRVIRARVLKGSRLIGKTAAEVDFRHVYKAAIVAVQSAKKSSTGALSSVRFELNDILILQASDDSPLLKRPSTDFYKNLEDTGKETASLARSTSVGSFVRMLRGRKNSADLSLDSLRDETTGSVQDGGVPAQLNRTKSSEAGAGGDEFFIPSDDEADEDDVEGIDAADPEAQILNLSEALQDAEQSKMDEGVWRDLQVIFREEGDDSNEGGTREFLSAMAVAPQSQLIGKNVTQNGINKLPDLFLVTIDRPVLGQEQADNANRQATVLLANINDASSVDENTFGSMRTEHKAFEAIDPDELLQEGDVLWFSGPASAVGDLRKIPGLSSYESEEVAKINEKVHDRRLVQAVVARKGPLVGKTVKETRFRTKYGAAVIAVHREDKRVHEHPGNVKLQAGDVLLLEAGPSFIAKNAENDKSFALLAEVEDSAPPRLRLLIPALLLAAGMLAVTMAGLTSLLVSALCASILMVAFGILSEQEARDAVNWDIYVTIAAAFGIGTALENSGVAKAVADFLVYIGTAIGLGDAGLLGAVYFATFLISNVVTNNAAAALLFPVAMDAAEQTGTDVILMSYALMLGASASFMSPFGYTTNLLVYGPGGYKYNDFLRFGTPMQIVLWILTVLYLSVIKPWYVSWIATFVCLLLVVVARLGVGSLRNVNFGKKKATDTNSRTDESSAVPAG